MPTHAKLPMTGQEKTHSFDSVKSVGLLLMVLSSILLFLPMLLRAKSGLEARLDVPTVTMAGSNLIVSTSIKDGFTVELEKTILSGKKVRFVYYVVLLRSRFFLFSDERIWRRKIEHTVVFDTATKEYCITFDEGGSNETKRFTGSPEEMRNYVGNLTVRVPAVIDRKSMNKEHYIRTNCVAVSSPLPGGFETRRIFSKKFIPSRLVGIPAP